MSDLVETLAVLLPSGRHAAVDLRGELSHFDVFVTFERRGGKKVPCGLRVVANGSEFVLDDGADEFAHSKLVGAPTFDEHHNVQISTVRHSIEGRRCGSSLWLAHDLSMIAVDDEVLHLPRP